MNKTDMNNFYEDKKFKVRFLPNSIKTVRNSSPLQRIKKV